MQQKVSLYQQIYDTVTSEIIAGRLKPGDQAPSESQLMEQFGVSRITAKRALDEMENSGFIERRRGAGNFVLEQGKNSMAQNECRSLIGLHIPILHPDVSETNHLKILQGITDYLGGTEYRAVLLSSNRDDQSERETLIEAYEEGYAGVICYPNKADEVAELFIQFAACGYPVVLMDSAISEIPLTCVTSDNILGSYELVQHLIERGHQQIGFMTNMGINDSSTVRERYLGYCKAMHEAGLKPDYHLTVTLYDSMQERRSLQAKPEGQIKHIQKALLQLRQRGCTALCTHQDYLAAQVVEACRGLGLSIPQDMAVTGFDNLSFSGYTFPPLTTEEQNFYEIGRRSAEALIYRIHHPAAKPEKIVIPPRLILRQSS